MNAQIVLENHLGRRNIATGTTSVNGNYLEARLLHRKVVDVMGMTGERMSLHAYVSNTLRDRADRFTLVDESTHRAVRVEFVPHLGVTSRWANVSIPWSDFPVNIEFHVNEIRKWFEMMEVATRQ